MQYSTIEEKYNPTKGFDFKLILEKSGGLLKGKFTDLDYFKISLSTSHFIKVADNQVLGIHGGWGVFKTSNSSLLTFESEGFEVGGAQLCEALSIRTR